MNYEIVTSAKEVLAKIKEKDYSQLYLDICMPDMDGESLLDLIRDEKLFTGRPIIAMTANALTAQINHYRTIGFSDILTKPFSQAELLTKVTTNR